MKSRIRPLGILVLTLLIASLGASSLFGAAFQYRSGLNFVDFNLVNPGYVVYSASDGRIYVVDVNGKLVKKIIAPAGGTYGYTRPLDNGNLLAKLTPVGAPDQIVELTQAGAIVWSFEAPAGVAFHHDQSRLANGNTLIMCARDLLVPEISPLELEDDCLLEVTPAGDIVWDWRTSDHFDDFGFDQQWKDAISDHAGDWAHANSASAIPSNNPHTDPRFAAGNVIISYRFLDTVVVVDRNTDAIVWRTNDYQTLGQHDAKMLPNNLDGAGNIMIFDNGMGGAYNFGGPEVSREYSRIVEIDPTDNSVAWQYNANDSGFPRHAFYSWFISSAQRLPNGNTFINEGAFGHFFEVTTDGTLAWDFINPVKGLFQGVDSNRIYRAAKVPVGWLQ